MSLLRVGSLPRCLPIYRLYLSVCLFSVCSYLPSCIVALCLVVRRRFGFARFIFVYILCCFAWNVFVGSILYRRVLVAVPFVVFVADCVLFVCFCAHRFVFLGLLVGWFGESLFICLFFGLLLFFVEFSLRRSALRVPPAETRLTVYRRLHMECRE